MICAKQCFLRKFLNVPKLVKLANLREGKSKIITMSLYKRKLQLHQEKETKTNKNQIKPKQKKNSNQNKQQRQAHKNRPLS